MDSDFERSVFEPPLYAHSFGCQGDSDYLPEFVMKCNSAKMFTK